MPPAFFCQLWGACDILTAIAPSQLGLGTGADSENLNQMASPGTCPAARDCNVNAGLPRHGVPPPPYPPTEAGYCDLCPQSYALADAATIQILAQNIAVSHDRLSAMRSSCPVRTDFVSFPFLRMLRAAAEVDHSTPFRSRAQHRPKVCIHKNRQRLASSSAIPSCLFPLVSNINSRLQTIIRWPCGKHSSLSLSLSAFNHFIAETASFKAHVALSWTFVTCLSSKTTTLPRIALRLLISVARSSSILR